MKAKLIAYALTVLAAAPLAAHDPDARTARGEAELAKEIAGRTPGTPQRCVEVSNIEGSRIIEGTAIVYRAFGGTLYVNRPGGAAMLHDDDIPVQFIYGSELCRLDSLKLLHRPTGMQRGFAVLEDFVPYKRPPKTP